MTKIIYLIKSLAIIIAVAIMFYPQPYANPVASTDRIQYDQVERARFAPSVLTMVKVYP